MVCFNDVNDEHIRMDALRCPKCESKAVITYGNNGKYIQQVEWKR